MWWKLENSTFYTKKPVKNQCAHIYFFSQCIAEHLWIPMVQGQPQNVQRSFFFPWGITKCNFTFLMLIREYQYSQETCLQSLSSPVISFCDYQPQILNRPAVLCGIKVNIESLGKIWKCSWSLKAMGKLIKFQHEILTQFNLMLSGLIVEMSSDYKLVSMSLKYM